MNVEKLSSDEVPQKFAEWLLAMGCPADKVPSVDKVAQMCRGQFYMVWRSLMEQVQPKDVVREKRMQVFCDDVKLCQNRNVFDEKDSSVVVPDQLKLWRQHQEVLERVADAEGRVTQARDQLAQLMDKVSSRMCQRNFCRKKVENVQRRVWLLRQVSEDLTFKKTNLEETKQIANSLCSANMEDDVQGKLDKCIALLRRQSQPASASLSLLATNPAASSSVMSNHAEDTEDQIASLVKCNGDALWTQLCERRAGLVSALSTANHADSPAPDSGRNGRRCTPQSVLAHTAALHCGLALEAARNRAHVKLTRARLAAAVDDLNSYMSGSACELLVLKCERARAETRAGTLRALLGELSSRAGAFALPRAHAHESQEPFNPRTITAVDKSIESTRDELKRLVLSLMATERKVHSIKEVLTAVFNSFQDGEAIERYRGVQLDFPQESIATLCQFYEERREKRRNKAELSLDLDVSDGSCSNASDNNNPTFVDELRIYLKKFSLENNRKLVMDSGEKVWVFETLQSSLERLYSTWLSGDVTPLLCPSTSLSQGIMRLAGELQERDTLESVVRQLNGNRQCRVDIDITSKTEQEAAAVDKIKKQIGENLQTLQKTSKTLELGQDNLKFWQDNHLKKYLSANRTVDGKTYKEYEAFYMERVSLSV